MVGCSAVNCTNSSEKGLRLFRVPQDPVRRKKWTINCRRDKWEPSSSARLCIVHFEESEFENKRADNWKKLKSNAVPTLFNVPNPPPQILSKRKKGIGLPKPGSILDTAEKIVSEHQDECESSRVNESESKEALEHEIILLRREKEKLQRELSTTMSKCASFLSEEQIKNLGEKTQSIPSWSKESIIKGLKLRFALGKHGYEYLRSTGYPAPSYSTLNRRIQGIHVEFGVLHNIINLLKTKIDSMPANDKLCCISFDEMEIASVHDFDTSSKSFVGQATLGNKVIANHYTIVLLRGLSSPWKQIIAHELTGPSTSGENMKDLIARSIEAVQQVGIQVRASVSDMGSNNVAMWRSVGVCVNKNKRITTYTLNNNIIHSLADIPHLIKNLRSAFLKRSFILPENICQENDLPSKLISSGFVKQLWIEELNSDSALRSLHHLNKVHLFPAHFNTMNVAPAVQLFSKTAAALEKAVSLRQLQKNALTTAWFIRLIQEWFHLVTARHRKVGFTQRNKVKKFEFLESFLEVIQNTKFGDSWKPFQTGIIMSTLSVMNLTKELLSLGYVFFLPGRLTQDAAENIFSQIRRKSCTKSTALQAKSAVKMICVSQFISDVKNSSYASDSDFHLFDTLATKSGVPSSLLDEKNEMVETPSTSTASQVSGESVKSANKVVAEENDIFYISGSVLNVILKHKNICDACKVEVKVVVDNEEPLVPNYRKHLNDYCNMGGLQTAPSGVYRICRETERLIQHRKTDLLSEKLFFDKTFVNEVVDECRNVILPNCCNLKEKIITQYFIVRCIGIKKHLINKKEHEKSFSSASVNKKTNRNIV